jgi:DNA-binding transcriptional LysR family regulator
MSPCVSAYARAMNITPHALSERVKTIERSARA